jgi:hypothetical protein
VCSPPSIHPPYVLSPLPTLGAPLPPPPPNPGCSPPSTHPLCARSPPPCAPLPPPPTGVPLSLYQVSALLVREQGSPPIVLTRQTIDQSCSCSLRC